MLIGQAGSALLSFVAIFAMTRYLGPERFGIYSTALSLALMLIPLSDLGFDLYMVRVISADTSRLSNELSRTLSIKAILSAVVWALMITAAFILRYDALLIGYVALIGLSLVIASLAQSFIGAIRAIRKMRLESYSLLAGRASTTLGILILIFLKANLTVIILAYLLGSILLLGSASYFLKKEIGTLGLFFSLSGWQARLAGALPFGITAILTAVYYKIDTVMLSKMQDTTSVGFYSSAQNLITGSMMLATPLVVSIYPAMAAVYKERKAEAENIFQRGLVFILLLGIPLGVGTSLMAGTLIKFIYGVKFLLAIPLLTIVAFKIPLVFSTLLIGNSLGAIGYQKKVAIATCVTSLFNIIMNLILIPQYGARAAATVTVATELLAVIQLLIITRGKLDLAIAPQFIKIIICCAAGTAGFTIFKGMIGSWVAAAVFAIIYAGLALAFKVISVSTVRDMLFPKSA